jgi:hypothetical protein
VSTTTKLHLFPPKTELQSSDGATIKLHKFTISSFNSFLARSPLRSSNLSRNLILQKHGKVGRVSAFFTPLSSYKPPRVAPILIIKLNLIKNLTSKWRSCHRLKWLANYLPLIQKTILWVAVAPIMLNQNCCAPCFIEVAKL